MATKTKKFKLGKLQKAWIKSLKEHPQRQTEDKLGTGNPKNYTACCLGELLLTDYRLKKKKLPFVNNRIKDYDFKVLDSYEKFGLKSCNGSFGDYYEIGHYSYNCLAEANDSGATWTEIAEFIKKNPEAVFTKSV